MEALYSKVAWRLTRLMRSSAEDLRVERPPRELQAASNAVKMKAYHTWLNMLSGFQLQEIKEAFKKFDRDGNGYMYVSRAQARARARARAQTLQISQLRCPGRLTSLLARRSDASELFTTMKMMGSSATHEQALRAAPENLDGSRVRVAPALSHLTPCCYVRVGQVHEMIRSVDVDGSGTVEFEEFLVIMARRIITTEGEMELEQARRPARTLFLPRQHLLTPVSTMSPALLRFRTRPHPTPTLAAGASIIQARRERPRTMRRHTHRHPAQTFPRDPPPPCPDCN